MNVEPENNRHKEEIHNHKRNSETTLIIFTRSVTIDSFYANLHYETESYNDDCDLY